MKKAAKILIRGLPYSLRGSVFRQAPDKPDLILTCLDGAQSELAGCFADGRNMSKNMLDSVNFCLNIGVTEYKSGF